MLIFLEKNEPEKKKKRKKGRKTKKNEKNKDSLAAIMIANQPFPGTLSSDADQNAPSTHANTAKKQIGIRMWVFQTVRKTSDMKQVLFFFFFFFLSFFRVFL